MVQRKDWAELFSLLEKGSRNPPTFSFHHYFFEWVQSWLQICCFSGIDDRGQWRDGPKWGHIHSNWFMQSPIQLTAVKRGVHILPRLLLKESNGGWFLCNLLGIQPLPGYSYVVEEARMGYLQQSGEKEDMWKNEKHTFMTPETDCTHSPSPSFKRNTEKIKKKKTLIEQPWVDWVKDEGIEDPMGGSPTHSSVWNRTPQCLCNWIFFALKGGMAKKEVSRPSFRVEVPPIV